MERGAGDGGREASVPDALELPDSHFPAQLRVRDDHQRLPPQVEPVKLTTGRKLNSPQDWIPPLADASETENGRIG